MRNNFPAMSAFQSFFPGANNSDLFTFCKIASPTLRTIGLDKRVFHNEGKMKHLTIESINEFLSHMNNTTVEDFFKYLITLKDSHGLRTDTKIFFNKFLEHLLKYTKLTRSYLEKSPHDWGRLSDAKFESISTIPIENSVAPRLIDYTTQLLLYHMITFPGFYSLPAIPAIPLIDSISTCEAISVDSRLCSGSSPSKLPLHNSHAQLKIAVSSSSSSSQKTRKRKIPADTKAKPPKNSGMHTQVSIFKISTRK